MGTLRLSAQPLQSALDHVHDLKDNIENYLHRVNSLPYPIVRKNLKVAGKNYQTGLNVIERCFREYLIVRGEWIAERSGKKGDVTYIDNAIKKYWGIQLDISYAIAERFVSDFIDEVEVNIPFELYFLVSDALQELTFEKRQKQDQDEKSLAFVLRKGYEFKTQTFEESIWDSLDIILKVGKEPLTGTLKQPSSKDIRSEEPLELAHLISYVRGEAENPAMWPVLVHEAVHLLDNHDGLFSKVEAEIKSNGKLPILEKENNDINEAWLREIFQDIVVVHYFGPAYLISIMAYFDKAPYYTTRMFPDVASRIYAVSRYLEEARSAYATDILENLRGVCNQLLNQQPDRIMIDVEMKGSLTDFYRAVTSWLKARGKKLFISRLSDYVMQSAKAPEMLKVIRDTSIASPFPYRISYVDPAFTFNDIVQMLFERNISLAIDYIIVLNVALSVSANIAHYCIVIELQRV